MSTIHSGRWGRKSAPPAAVPDDGTQSRPADVQHLFGRISAQLLAEHPGDAQGRMLRADGLKTHGKFYAFTTQNDLVVKLPASRVIELIAAGTGRACDPRGGRPMRQWVRITPGDEHSCTAYVTEARAFVASDTHR